MSFTYTVAGLFLVAFGAYVASLIWSRNASGGVSGPLALGGSLLATAFWLLAAIVAVGPGPPLDA